MAYNRNKGVRSILEAMQAGDPDEIYPHGAKFDMVTGRITHNIEGQEANPDLCWLCRGIYPVYSKSGEIRGIKSGTNFINISKMGEAVINGL